MTVWYKQGVLGCLNNQPQKCLGRIHALHQKHKDDLYITSVREGTHSAGSLHPIGDAFDFRYSIHHIDKATYELVAGSDFDIVFELDHIHCEYDPR